MAKILVADDNSNVQKTVKLALADLGIEVVAVNNGEAAVRKLVDVSPDLVLADIFMPVRNGYEVCEYIKKDSRFSHVPVVLLVGAFDPLDEREAQRVGADGILKKPFVPPDPLIAMVKMLLDRTLGDRLVAVAASKPAVASLRKKAGGIATADGPSSPAQISEELPEEEEFRPPVERLSFGDGARPMAFGQLLDAPTEEVPAAGSLPIDPVQDEQILTSARDASLGDPVFWKTEEPSSENSEANSETHSEIASDLPMQPWKPDEEAIARNAHNDILQPVEPFELVREENDQESGQTSTIVESSPISLQDAAAQASLTVEAGRPDDLAANPIEWMASVPAPPAEEIPEAPTDWGALSGSNEAIHENQTTELGLAIDAAPTESPTEVGLVTPEDHPPAVGALEIPDIEKTHPSLNSLAQSAEETARSVTKQEWAELAASVETRPADKTLEQPESAIRAVEIPPAFGNGPEQAPANFERLASKPTQQSTEDTVRSIPRHDWAANFHAKPSETLAQKVEQQSEKAESGTTVATPASDAAATDFDAATAHSEGSASQPTVQGSEDRARSISKRDWADLAATFASKRTDDDSEKPTSPSEAKQTALPDARVSPADAHANAFSALASVAQSTVADEQLDSANSASPGAPDPVLVEAVVQRILEKWRPQVVDIITKEFLRPIVQALVQREIVKR